MKPTIELYNGECSEVMDELNRKGVKVNAIITDPPYGTVACPWDNIIPFKEMWKSLDLLKINSNVLVVLFGKQPFTSNLIMSNAKEYREIVVWLKNKAGNGFQSNQKHIQVLEDIIVFSSNGTFTYNPQKWLVAEKEFLTQRKTFKDVDVGNNIYAPMKMTRKKDNGERYPINIISCRVPFNPSESKTYSDNVDIRYHPTQKPVKLMEYLVKTIQILVMLY